MRKIAISVVGALLLAVGCSSSSDESVDWSKGRGSAACHDWQEAYCQLALDCGGTKLTECAAQIQTLTCADDAAASGCATELDKGVCSSANVGGGCSPLDVADRGAASQSCSDYLTAVCTHDSNCGSGGDVAACVANLQGSSNCSKALGVKLNYESCMTKINALSCSSTLPAECSTLIYVGP